MYVFKPFLEHEYLEVVHIKLIWLDFRVNGRMSAYLVACFRFAWLLLIHQKHVMNGKVKAIGWLGDSPRMRLLGSFHNSFYRIT